MSISLLRAGLAKNLGTIKGLRVVETLPDLVNPPMAMIGLAKVAYNQQNQRSMAEYTFQVTVVLGRVSERTAQRDMDVLVAPGEGSVKYAIESDRTLGGNAYDVFVSELSAIGALQVNGIDYYSAEFSVQVFAR
jgi:F0F1-type ATP synthase gamma subunit